jgi:dTDP-4-amino-4,6-dideoxygalactose transaminase
MDSAWSLDKPWRRASQSFDPTVSLMTAMHVPLVDLPIQFRSLRTDLMAAIEGVLESGQLFLGPNTARSSRSSPSIAAASSRSGWATAPMRCTWRSRAAGIGPGDEVITVSHTFIALTIEAIAQVGADRSWWTSIPRTHH